jgi:hypothetical protein
VTIPRRTDNPNAENRRSRLLAELPYVGEVAAVPPRRSMAEEVAASPPRTKSNHPAFAELDDYADEPHTLKHQSQRTLRYVDQAHIDPDTEEQVDWQESERISRGRQSQPRSQMVQLRPNQQHRRAAGVGRILSETHEQLAPFAGLIVTAALIACAGLLILVMASGKQSGEDLDRFAVPGFSVEADGELSPDDAPLADSAFMPEAVEPDGMEYEPPQTAEPKSSPPSAAPADASAAIPQPVIDEITEPSVPLGQLSFPITSTPLALDYSKAFEQTADALQELPTVAERDNAATTEPINR